MRTSVVPVPLRVLHASHHLTLPACPPALRLQIDIGEGEPRQVASGLRAHYSLEQMEGRKIVVICNLKPRKMVRASRSVTPSHACRFVPLPNTCGLLLPQRGFVSHGMVLCANGPDGKVEVRAIGHRGSVGFFPRPMPSCARAWLCLTLTASCECVTSSRTHRPAASRVTASRARATRGSRTSL